MDNRGSRNDKMEQYNYVKDYRLFLSLCMPTVESYGAVVSCSEPNNCSLAKWLAMKE